MTETVDPWCCHLDCQNGGVWQIESPPFSYESNTVMCDQHVAEYTQDGDVVYPLQPEAAQEALP